MILDNLNELGIQIQEKIKNYDNKELILSDEFKNEFKNFLLQNSKDSIEFQKYTTIVTTSKELKIIFPNQWFYIASFFYDFLNSLWKYKGLVNELNLNDEIIKDLRKNIISSDLKSIIQTKISDEKDFAFFELFLTNYDWWYGSKTIDRGDFFVSSVLNLSNVVNVSHSYLADLAYYFSKDEGLNKLISKDYENLFNQNNLKTNAILLEEKYLRNIIFETFKFVLNEYGEENVFRGSEIKDSIIEDREYKGLTIPDFFGFEIIFAIFNKPLDIGNLKSSNTKRYFEEAITIFGNAYSYFTTQWNSDTRGLSLINFNKYLAQISNNNLEIIKDNINFKLVSKGKDNNSSTLKKTEQKIYYGAPGTGKSYKVDNQIKNLSPNFYERLTFHPEFDHSSFIGGYKPVSAKDINGNDIIKYQFVSQAFTNIYYRAWSDSNNQYYLVIEEINRGNCAEIFGDIFQLLDRNSNYTVSPSDELKTHLIEIFGDENHDGIVKGLRLPSNLSILATMNTSDQSLFPMDSAFKRRWDWEYIPICYDDIPENESFGYEVKIDENASFKWIDFIKNVNAAIKTNPNLGMDKCIGNYFIKSETNEITLKEFINKAVFYLWNDVFKDEDSSDSIFEKGISYEDFFPIDTNGKEKVEKILNDLKIDIINTVKV